MLGRSAVRWAFAGPHGALQGRSTASGVGAGAGGREVGKMAIGGDLSRTVFVPKKFVTSSGPARDAVRQQVLAGWQHIADGHTIANLNKRILKPTAETLRMGWVSWHAFRRTHATLMDQENAAIADRIAQMGHSALAMTLKYTSADIERRRGIVELVSALIHGSGGREPSESQG